ncbi:EF-P 5-aminopentanol modification-associated protein YfmH [Apilactobacillus apinorum]|uniref:EF-P 5-aminopentanol modification-associated protein YfmH n=1 Tax=Apilactobacillus apinorum TaxID=1218495 RepID=UPI0006B650DF|nr:pitrilysin family protein [Apilactobacillus apinorum]KOY69124.1 Zinc-dependent proteinase, M16 family [Apilactobacillus apinorum]CAI2650917.1 Zinc-dependent proteinase, M16 family [Apilactobacillus apinorum]
MEIKNYQQYGDKVYIDELDNGLSVVMIPKSGYHKTYATFSVNYGSIDTTINGKKYPAGIAHFLEHKMFDKKDHDAMDVFSKYGASSNAFTNFNKTSYLFATTDNVHDNLIELLDFVQEPYFDEQKVEKEKGIIGQEISMYDDNPGSVLFFKTIQNMYPDTPLNVDIAGSQDSINKITKDDLYDSYNYFYQPSNMQLTIVGDINPEETLKWVIDNQNSKKLPTAKTIDKTIIESNDLVRETTQRMDVKIPKVAIGIKGNNQFNNDIKYELSISLLLQMLLSEGSEVYEKLYNDGIIDDSFGFDFDCEDQFNYAIFAGETDDVDSFYQAITKVLFGFEDIVKGLNEEFELIKREEIGQHISMMNSIEAVSNSVNDKDHNYRNLYDEIDIIKSLQLNDVIYYGKMLLKEEFMVKNIILPQK